MVSLMLFYLVQIAAYAGEDQPKLVTGKPPSSWDENKKFTLLDDSMRQLGSCLISESRCVEMLKIYQGDGSDLKKASENIRSVVCNGPDPRVKAQFNVLLVPPKPKAGMAVDKAGYLRTRFIDAAREYLKTQYLSDLALTTSEHESYGRSYQRAIEGWSNKQKELTKFSAPPNRVTTSIFLTNSADMKGIREAIEGTPYETNLYDLTLNSLDVAVTLPRAFMTIQSFSGGEAVLTGRLTMAAQTEWFKEDDGFELRKLKVDERWQQNSNAAKFYIVGENTWEIQGKKYHVLNLGALLDLKILLETHTFMLPINVIKKLWAPRKGDLQYYGYDASYEKVKFSPTKALQHREFLWRKVLSSQSTIKESAQSDGSVRFSVESDFGLLCKYGASVAGLTTQ